MYGAKLLSQREGDLPYIEVKFIITNKLPTSTLNNLHLTPSASSDFAHDESETIDKTETLSPRATVEISTHFNVKSSPKQSMRIEYSLQYESGNEPHSQQLIVDIPVATFMLEEAKLDPSGFANMLAERGHEFSHRSSATVVFPIPNDKPVEEVLTHGLEMISRTTRLDIVEMVPGAASLYGKSVQGIEVAGLLKYAITGEEEEQSASMRLELKCTDSDFADAITAKVSSMS
jgi:AP-3 complex subunit delta-1